ncbi:VOC family protein [soil metagenome]
MVHLYSHSSAFVLDQDSAKTFYVDKLGFEVRTDATMDGGFRWLTVGTKAQPDLELILMPTSSIEDLEDRADVERLIRKGVFGIGVLETLDVKEDYERLKGLGVEFKSEPSDEFYGIESIGQDDSGNWFSYTQRKAH